MKVYIIRDSDFDALNALVDRDPLYGPEGGSHTEFTQAEVTANRAAHAFYNFQVKTWIGKMKEPQL